MKHFKSKRFTAYIISLIIWLVCVLGFKLNMLECATALLMLVGIYLGAESLKPSEPKA